jgi:hypothetical protein
MIFLKKMGQRDTPHCPIPSYPHSLPFTLTFLPVEILKSEEEYEYEQPATSLTASSPSFSPP